MFSLCVLTCCCGLVMNKDEIQLSAKIQMMQRGCGLVMNKDEIQRFRHNGIIRRGCGLVMNKDEIQLARSLTSTTYVVVW